MDWQSFAKWMEGKVEWQIFMVIISGALFGIAKAMSSTSSSSSASPKPKYQQLSTHQTRLSRHIYATAPTKCYCHSCGREILMVGELAGKHCREIETCPVCGAGGYPLWRKRA